MTNNSKIDLIFGHYMGNSQARIKIYPRLEHSERSKLEGVIIEKKKVRTLEDVEFMVKQLPQEVGMNYYVVLRCIPRFDNEEYDEIFESRKDIQIFNYMEPVEYYRKQNELYNEARAKLEDEQQ